MTLIRRYDPTPAGLAALESSPMTPAEVADLVERTHAHADPDRDVAGHWLPMRVR